jgi:hypothetical protein
MADFTFFGIQLLVRTGADADLRKRIHQVIAEGGAAGEQSLADKRALYKRLTTLLVADVVRFDLGYWDYIADPGHAEREFDEWCSELEGRMATEKEEVGAGVDDVNRLSAKPEYIAVTVCFLLEAGGNSDQTVAERCDLPESDWFKRDTFVRLFETLPMLSFSSVKADAVYLVPGNEEDGLSFDDVHGGGWEYLKQLS